MLSKVFLPIIVSELHSEWVSLHRGKTKLCLINNYKDNDNFASVYVQFVSDVWNLIYERNVLFLARNFTDLVSETHWKNTRAYENKHSICLLHFA